MDKPANLSLTFYAKIVAFGKDAVRKNTDRFADPFQFFIF